MKLVQNGLMFPEEKTKKILKDLLLSSSSTTTKTKPHEEDTTVTATATSTSGGALLWEDESFDDGGNFAFNQDRLAEYVLELAQTRSGGLCDKPDLCSDLYHTCYSLSGLSVSVANDEKTKMVEEFGKILNTSSEASDDNRNTESESTNFGIMVKKLLEAYQFEKFEASDSLKSTPFQSTHPLLNLTRKRVKFAWEFFGGRDSML